MSNFLRDYVSYARELTDAPMKYHQAVAIALVSAAVANRAWFPFGDQRLYCNLYMILLGTSSDTRKSTSLNMGKAILCQVKPEAILPNEFSHEKLLALLSQTPQGCFFYSEFLSLQSLLSRDYMAGTRSFLTELYDCPSLYRREIKGADPIAIENPVISILSATTVEWFLERLSEIDFLSGWLNRFILIFGTRSSELLPLPPKADLEKKAALISELQRISQLNLGEASLSPEALQLHNQWYKNHLCSLNGCRYAAFQHRAQQSLLKIALLMEIAATSSVRISGRVMEEAIFCIEGIRDSLAKIEGDELTFSKSQRHVKAVKKYLAGRGRVPRSQLLKRTQLSAREIDDAIRTLIESELVTVYNEKNDGAKKQTTFYEYSAKSLDNL